jgi:hypothetical protein
MFISKCNYIITNIKLVSEVSGTYAINTERTLAESHCSYEVNSIFALLFVRYVASLEIMGGY